MRRGRHLDWNGCVNCRDLGGLPTTKGQQTRWGALVRSDSLSKLTGDGWAALVEHGVRTVIDLRNEDERNGDASPRPAALTTVEIPLDVTEDREFWAEWGTGPQFGTPLYYGPHLRRFPHRNAAVISAVANAGPGGVAFHCVTGRDRAGQVAMLLLALAGVRLHEITADYTLSIERLKASYEERGEEDQPFDSVAYLSELHTTPARVIEETLESVDLEAHLRDRGGLTENDLVAIRNRVVASDST